MTDSAAGDKDTLLIDLNFVPNWARKPPVAGGGDGAGVEDEVPAREDRPRGRDESRHPRDGNYGGRRERRRDDAPVGGSAPERGAGPRLFRDRGRGPRDDAGARPERPVAASPADERLKTIEVTFLPERHGLGPLAHRLARSARAYSLFEVASLFLSKPEFHAVKLEVQAGADAAPPLFQCGECKAVFLDREAVASHAFARHFEKFCRKEEKEGEAPKGNFVCVARCGLSGTLLGPPNYHGYADRVAEVHRTRYAGMPIDAYRKRIETVHDPAAIEQWREEMKRQVAYRCGEGDQAPTFTRFSDAEAWFREHCLPPILKEGKHFVLPGAVARDLDDARLKRWVDDARQREDRFPLRLSIALRLAFRHLGMHTFKTAGGLTFLTAVVPSPIDPGHAVPVVRAMLDYIAAKPGCTRPEMAQALCAAPAAATATPVSGAESEAAAAPAPEAPPTAPCWLETDVNNQLRWLVEKGHVIEFSDGRLAAPGAAVARMQMAHPHGHARREPRTADRKKSRVGHGREPVPEEEAS